MYKDRLLSSRLSRLPQESPVNSFGLGSSLSLTIGAMTCPKFTEDQLPWCLEGLNSCKDLLMFRGYDGLT